MPTAVVSIRALPRERREVPTGPPTVDVGSEPLPRPALNPGIFVCLPPDDTPVLPFGWPSCIGIASTTRNPFHPHHFRKRCRSDRQRFRGELGGSATWNRGQEIPAPGRGRARLSLVR